jgi:hypothetical protein
MIESSPGIIFGSTALIAASEFTRPADTTAYTAGDVVGTSPAAVITLSNCARVAGGSGIITSVRLAADSATTANGIFRVYFFSTAPTAIADNSPFTLLWANRAIRVGAVDLTLRTEGSGSDSAEAFNSSVVVPFTCASSSKDLTAVLVAEAAYAPKNAGLFRLEVGIVQD